MPNPIAIPRPAFLTSLRDTLAARLQHPRLLRAAFALLRRFAPVLRLGETVVVSTHADVQEVLSRDGEFSVVRDNGTKMDAVGVTFALGMDPSERYTREKHWLNHTILAGDLARVRATVRERAEELLDAAGG